MLRWTTEAITSEEVGNLMLNFETQNQYVARILNHVDLFDFLLIIQCQTGSIEACQIKHYKSIWDPANISEI